MFQLSSISKAFGIFDVFLFFGINELFKEKDELDQQLAYFVQNLFSVLSDDFENLWIYRKTTIVNDFVFDDLDLIVAVDTTISLKKSKCRVWTRKGDSSKLKDLRLIKNYQNYSIQPDLSNEYVIFEENEYFHKIDIESFKMRMMEIYRHIQF